MITSSWTSLVNFVVCADKSILILEHWTLMDEFETIVRENSTFVTSNHFSLQIAFRDNLPKIIKAFDTMILSIGKLDFLETADFTELMTFNDFIFLEKSAAKVHSFIELKCLLMHLHLNPTIHPTSFVLVLNAPVRIMIRSGHIHG